MTAKELKNALLQEAVQGKLVPQIASEGNARDLLEEIHKEKAKLVKEGKLKKEKPLPDIAEDEIPFDIPKNWCWCRLGEIFETTSGTTPQSKNPIYYNNGTIGWVRTTDLNNGILSFAEIKITEKARTDCNLKMIPKNSVCIALYGGAGTIGKNAILNFETTINQSVCAMLPNSFADMRYLQYFLQWQRPYWMDYASGSRKDPNINQIIVKNCPFPLPPLAEQKRIVDVIEKFMPLIEEYGKKETELKAFNEQIGTLIKKAILQEAVQGKLVPQIAAEGSAKNLLEEIKKEKAKLIKEGKIKKEKLLPEITEDEIPSDIPDSWCWCRLGEIINEFLVPQRDKPKVFSGNIPWCRIEDIEGMYLNGTLSNKYVSMETVKSMNLKVNPIGTVISANSASIGAAAITTVECCTNQTFIGLVCSGALYNYYLYYYLKSITNKLKKMGSGTTISYISQDKYKEMLFPLPPLAEQKRIVAAIEKLLPLCEKLGN